MLAQNAISSPRQRKSQEAVQFAKTLPAGSFQNEDYQRRSPAPGAGRILKRHLIVKQPAGGTREERNGSEKRIVCPREMTRKVRRLRVDNLPSERALMKETLLHIRFARLARSGPKGRFNA